MKLDKEELNTLIDLITQSMWLTTDAEAYENYETLRLRLENYLAKITR